jgi:hypothetical protein
MAAYFTTFTHSPFSISTLSRNRQTGFSCTATYGGPDYARSITNAQWVEKHPWRGDLFRDACFYVEDTNGTRENNVLCNLIAVGVDLTACVPTTRAESYSDVRRPVLQQPFGQECHTHHSRQSSVERDLYTIMRAELPHRIMRPE